MKKKFLFLFFVVCAFFFVGCKSSKKEITIVFNTNGGSIISNQTISLDKLNTFVLPVDPVRENYTFEGWYLDYEFNEKFIIIPKDTKDNLILYAKWEKSGESDLDDPNKIPVPKFLKMEMVNKEKITNNSNSNFKKTIRRKDTVIYDYKVNIDTEINVVIILESNDYDSVVDVVINDSEYGPNCIYLPNSTKFKIVRQDILFNKEFNSYVTEVEIVLPRSLTPYERIIKIEKIELLRKVVSDQKFEAKIDNNDDIDLIFQVRDVFDVNFIVDGQYIIEETLYQKYNSKIDITFKPVKEGHTFVGWYMDSEFKDKLSYTTMPNQDLTLYAKFELNKVDIKFIDQNNKEILIKIDWGTTLKLEDVPILESSKDVIYIWNENNFEFIKQSMVVETIKLSELKLTYYQNTIKVDFYLDDKFINSKPIFNIYSDDKKLDKELKDFIYFDLPTNKNYKVIVKFDDMNVEKEIYLPKLKPIINITPDIITTDEIKFNLEYIDIDLTGNVNNISLYQEEKLIEKLVDNNMRTFKKLKSNTDYIIAVDYSYDLNDGDGIINDKVNFKINTLKVMPEVLITNIYSSTTESGFDVKIKDDDKAGKISKIDLIKNEKVYKTINNSENFKFENLLSNNLYNVKLYYDYDLRDGKGIQTLEINKELKTKAKEKPIVEIDQTKVVETNNSIDFEFKVIDKDNTNVKINKLMINYTILGEKIVKELDISTKRLDNLYSDTSYVLTYFYSYDLNDGNGVINADLAHGFKTLEKVAPVIYLDIASANEKGINFDLNIKDVDNICTIKKIELIDLINNKTFILEDVTQRAFTNITINTKYKLVVIYEYDRNIGYIDTATKEINFNHYFVTFHQNNGLDDIIIVSSQYETLKQLPIPRKDNEMFIGWYKTPTFDPTTRVYAPTAITQILKETNLYAKYGNPDDIFIYEILNGEIIITGINKVYEQNDVLYIPNTINNIPVVSIKGLNIHGLNSNAFLEYVYIPKNIKNIGDNTFYMFSKLNTVEFEKDSKLLKIGKNAFNFCGELRNIILPENLVEIGEQAFANCGALIEFTIPANVQIINAKAFFNCSRLATIEFLSNSCANFSDDIFPSLNLMISKILVNGGVYDEFLNKYQSYEKILIKR